MPTNPYVYDLYPKNQQQGMQPQGGGMAMPQPNPQQQMMQQPPQQEAYNPFDVGISRGVQSARAALQMAPDQESRALRQAMLSFGNAIGSQPKTRGFMSNLGAGLQALGPAVASHDEAEAAAMAENQAQAEKLIAYQMAKQQQEAQEQQRKWNQDFHERQLGETKRAHDMMHSGKGIDSNGIDRREERKTTAFEAKENIKSNNKYIDKVKPIIDEAEIKNRVMDKLATILKTESAAGGTPVDAFNRYLKKVSGNDSNLTQAAMLKKYFFKDIKGVAGNPNIKEWNDLVNTMITLDKNVDGSLAMIDYEKSENQKKIDEYNSLRKVLSKTGRRLHYDSQEIRDMIDQDLGGTHPAEQQHESSSPNPVVEEVKIYFRLPNGAKIGIPASDKAALDKARMQQFPEVQ